MQPEGELVSYMRIDQDDPYQVLGVSRAATVRELKSAYRKLSMKWHPDRHAGAPEALRQEAEQRFKTIHTAYQAATQLVHLAASHPASTHMPGSSPATSSSRGRAAAWTNDVDASLILAIQSVVHSVALRLLPRIDRYSYRRVTSVVEHILLRTLAEGYQTFTHGFETAIYEAMAVIGANPDLQAAILNVLDFAAAELRAGEKGIGETSWEHMLTPLESARSGS